MADREPGSPDGPHVRTAHQVLAERMAAQRNGLAAAGYSVVLPDRREPGSESDHFMPAGYSDPRPGGPYRDTEFIAWLASTGRSHNQFSSHELGLALEAWEAGRRGGAGSPRFADLDWQERWNGTEAVAALSQSGPDVMATGFFGVLRFRLDRPADVAAIVNAARQFAAMAEEAGREYEAGVRHIVQRGTRWLPPGTVCTGYWYAQRAGMLPYGGPADPDDAEFLAALGQRAARLARQHALEPSWIPEGPDRALAWPEWIWSAAADAIAQHAAGHGDYGTSEAGT